MFFAGDVTVRASIDDIVIGTHIEVYLTHGIVVGHRLSKTLFRAIYYTVLLCLLLPLWWWEKQDFLFLLPIGILWLYRVSRYVWSLCATTARP